MKVIGKLSELVKVLFRQNTYEITLDTNTDTTYTGNRTVLLPEGDQDDTIVGRLSSDVGADRLQNKELSDDNVLIVDPADTTKKARIDVGGITTGTTRAFSVPDADTTLVGTDATQTLTSKTIDADSNTITNIADAEIKASAGIALNKLAGTTVSQLLFSDASGFITTEGVGTAAFGTVWGHISSVSENVQDALTAEAAKVSADGSIGTHSDVDVTTEAPVSGDVLTFDGTNWAPAESTGGGSGSGEVNFNDNPNAVLAVDGNNTNDVGDYISSGAGATVARTTTAGDLPRSPYQTTGTKVTFAAGTADYVRLRFRVPPADRGKKLKIEFAQLAASYVAQTGKIELYNYSDAYVSDVAEVALHGDDSSGDSYLPNATGVYYNEFDADDREYYELRIVNAGATAGTITINDFVIGPGKLHSGAVVTKWEEFTMTVEAVSSNPTKNGSPVRDKAYKRRVGSDMEINWSYYQSSAGTAGSGIYKFKIPDSLTIDSSSIIVTTSRGQGIVGAASGQSTTDGVLTGYVQTYDSTSLSMVLGNSTTDPAQVASTFVDLGETATLYSFRAVVPIAEWAGSGVLNVITQDNLTEWTSYTPTISGVGTATSVEFEYRQVGDSMQVRGGFTTGTVAASEIQIGLPSGYTIGGGTTSVVPVGDLLSDAAVTSSYWYLLSTKGDTYLNVGRNQSGTSENALSPANGNAVLISSTRYAFTSELIPITEFAGSQSSLVGFSEVSQDHSGLVQSAGQLKGTNTNDDAAAGYVGEYIEDHVELAGAWSASTGVTAEVASITLTPGDWDISFILVPRGGASTKTNAWVGTASAATTGRNLGSNWVNVAGTEATAVLPSYRVTPSSSTTYYLNAAITYSSAPTAHGYRLSARRVR